MACKIKTKRLKWLAALLLLVAAMVMPATAWAQITPEKPNDGNGTSDSPFGIQCVEHLYWFAAYVNGSIDNGTPHPSACAKLDQNITINSKVLNEDGTFAVDVSSFIPLTPIGSSSNGAYNGTFDGDGHTISGLYFNDTIYMSLRKKDIH